MINTTTTPPLSDYERDERETNKQSKTLDLLIEEYQKSKRQQAKPSKPANDDVEGK